MTEVFSLTLSSDILQSARELGFDQAGITVPEALLPGEQALAAWVGEDRHGSMKYLEEFSARKERFFRDFPEAKSVIVLGLNYYQKDSASQNSDDFLRGRVARYAWGKDYHIVIKRMHQALIQKMQAAAGTGFKAVSCVDTQPIPERYAAVRAGVGFIGKHTGLLSRKFGPWLFLSEIVTNLELDENLPDTGDCGTCDHCQTACPTGALDQDYRMDARLCIAYLTIEHRGIIPRELRSKVKDWIFGCDECLTVCPFTSKAQETEAAEFKLQEGAGPKLSIESLFEISTNREYEEKFAGTALLRSGRKQMLRNACIVLGNSGRKEALPYLEKALRDKAELVRLHAAWALGNLPFPEAEAFLRSRLEIETDAAVKDEVRFALEARKAAS